MTEFDINFMLPERLYLIGVTEGLTFYPVLMLNDDQMASLRLSVNRAWEKYRPVEMDAGMRGFIESVEGLDKLGGL